MYNYKKFGNGISNSGNLGMANHVLVAITRLYEFFEGSLELELLKTATVDIVQYETCVC